METEKAKGANKDFAVLAAMKKRLKASHVLDITAHKEQLQCAARVVELNARVAELNAQYPLTPSLSPAPLSAPLRPSSPLSPLPSLTDHERCGEGGGKASGNARGQQH